MQKPIVEGCQMTDGLLLIGLAIAFAIAEIVRLRQWHTCAWSESLDPTA